MQQKFIFIVFFSILISTIACKKVDIQFGNDLIDDNSTRIIKVDSFGVDLSTIYIDSFATSSMGTTFLGQYTDPEFGKITPSTYFEVQPPIYSEIYDNTSFDSLTLILKLNKTYYGDSTQKLHIDVSRLAEKIVPPDNGSSLYNVDAFQTSGIIASKDIVVNPRQTDTICIRLPNSLGQQILQKLQSKNDDSVKTADNFINFFNGLKISTNNSNGNLIVGCSDSAIMRLQYKKADIILQNLNADFTLANKAHHFVNIAVDRTGTKLGTLGFGPNNKEISSLLTGNFGYTQPISSTMLKLTFPSLRDLLKVTNFAKVLRAQLIIRPASGTYMGLYTLPPSLQLYTTTQLNLQGTALTAIGSSGAAEVQTGNLYIDYLYGQNTTYSYDISTYIKAILQDATVTKNGLLVLPPSPAYQTSFARLVAGDRLAGTSGRIELQIYYLAVQ